MNKWYWYLVAMVILVACVVYFITADMAYKQGAEEGRLAVVDEMAWVGVNPTFLTQEVQGTFSVEGVDSIDLSRFSLGFDIDMVQFEVKPETAQLFWHFDGDKIVLEFRGIDYVARLTDFEEPKDE